VRNANAIDLASRTLLIEVDVDNPGAELLPGAYVFVHLKMPTQAQSITVPANALLFRAEGLQAAVVHDGQAQLVPVRIGRDYGSTSRSSPVCSRPTRSSWLLGFDHQRHARADRPRAGRAEPMTRRAAGLAGLVAVLLGGCMVGPKYKGRRRP